MFVQRYLCSRSAVTAGRALMWSGVFVFVQFGLFLTLGLLLWVYYTAYAPAELALLTVEGQVPTDRVLPHFMMTHLPGRRPRPGGSASIMAAAMSTLSSSLNSSAASTVGDFLRHGATAPPCASATRPPRVAGRRLWGGRVVQLAVALVAAHVSRRVVDEVLGIQSFTLGLLLGASWLASTRWCRPRGAVTGIGGGAASRSSDFVSTSDVSWQWYVLIGTMLTFGIGWLTERRSVDVGADGHE